MGGHVTKPQTLISAVALAAGVGAVIASLVVTDTDVGAGLTFGFGAFIAFFALLSLLVRNRAPDYFGLLVVGVMTFLLPFLGEAFVSDRGAAWTAWIAGFVAMVLGGVGWLRSTPPAGLVAPGAHPAGPGGRRRFSGWIGRLALVVGLGTAVLAATVVRSSTVGIIVVIGLSGMAAVIGLWSLLAVDPTRDYLTLAVVGFALFLSPWAVKFSGESAGWTAWLSGALLTALGVAGYLTGESSDAAAPASRNITEAR